MQQQLFPRPEHLLLKPGVMLLRGFAVPFSAQLQDAIRAVVAAAPFRHMMTPRGTYMSVAMTNCGEFGWVTDRSGYRYTRIDPDSKNPWPDLPELFTTLSRDAAELSGFPRFSPDACLLNRYQPGARMALHQDRDERDFTAPIVSISLGLPAFFLLGGTRRSDPPARIQLQHGDVLVWGGPSRMLFHGIAPIAARTDQDFGAYRFNLTLRKAGSR
jgi:alkylated DNA repair protein (DNA oxidative demethylase)